MKTIIFDETSASWTKYTDCNSMFLRYQANYIEELFKHRGYMYLNQIYEHFGIGWNPRLVNVCYLLGSGPIKFEFEPVEDGKILIHIS